MVSFWRWQCSNSYFLKLAMCQPWMCTQMYGIVYNPTRYICSSLVGWRSLLPFSLKLIISFLVQLQHLLLPSLINTSSQVSVGAPLPLLSCCISGLGPEGLLHNRMIPVLSPGNLLRVTLASREYSASENLRRETQRPKCCLYETPYVAAPIREIGDVIARTPLSAQLPTDAPTRTRFFFGSRVMHFSRDPSC